MSAQDDIALLHAMREHGQITDDEYIALRRHLLWGAPLPPWLADRHPGIRSGGQVGSRHPDDGPAGSRPESRPAEHRSTSPVRYRPGQAERTERPQRTERTQQTDRGRRVDRPEVVPVIPGPGRALERAARADQADQADRPEPPGRRASPGQAVAVRRPGPLAVPSVRLPVRSRRRRRISALVSAVLVLALVALGAWWFALRVSPVQPNVYAHRVCTTVSRWQNQMADSRAALVSTLDSTKPPQAIRDGMVRFYSDAEERTAKLSVALARIGPPNVVGGADYARALRQAVATTAASFHDDAEHAGQLDTSTRLVFTLGVHNEVASIYSRAQPMFDALSGRGLEPPLDLRAAFDSDPTCAAYTG